MCVKKVLVIASYDSFLKSGIAIAEKIDDALVDICIHENPEGKKMLSSGQLIELGIDKKQINYFHLDHYFEKQMYEKYDIVILSFGNSLYHRFFKFYYKIYKQEMCKQVTSPIIISIFPGVIFGDKNSILARMLSDIVLYLCPFDYEIAEKLKNTLNFKSENILYGFPNVVDQVNTDNENKKIYFIDQVAIPSSKENRNFLLKKMVDLAKRYPEQNFVILPRVNEDENTVHTDHYPYRRLALEYNLPTNLVIERTSLKEALQDMKLCISMSSTVVFEAVALGIPIYMIKDLGVKKEFANTIFEDSGVLAYLDDLDLDSLPRASGLWLSQFYFNSSDRDLLLNRKVLSFERKTHDYSVYVAQIIANNRLGDFFIRKYKKFFRNPKAFFKDSVFLARFFKQKR